MKLALFPLTLSIALLISSISIAECKKIQFKLNEVPISACVEKFISTQSQAMVDSYTAGLALLLLKAE
jgi:hypothetical protein